MMKNKIKLNGGHLILMVAVFVLLYLCLKDVFVKNNIEKNGKEIVVKFTSKIRLPKTTNFYFTYFVNGKRYNSANSGINYNISDSNEEIKNINNLKINAFYFAKSISKYPNIIIVNPVKQVTDTMAILKKDFQERKLKRVI
ncbi:hypothetical protein [Flavobacterium sp. LAR06]|uniref:hypothetical protein n=1 Tax=Flavobacterium sp. LAR06 TaxID=3064897 RepID=UPI0035C072D1